MSSTVSIAQYAARAEAAEAKIAELTNLAAQIQAVSGASGSSGSGEAGIGEFKNYFLEKLKTLRVAVAEEHEEFVRTQAKNKELEKEVTKLRYRVEILTRELSAKLGTPVPESIFKDFKEEAEAPQEAKNENQEKDKKGKDKEKDKGKDKDKEKDKGKDKEKEKDKKGDKKGDRKPSEKAERKPSERKQSEKAETPASTEPTVTVHAAEGGDKGKKAAKGKDQGKKDEGKKEEAAPAQAGEQAKKAEPKKGGDKPKRDSTRTESEKGEAAPDAKKGGKPDAKKGGDAQKKGGDAQKKGDAKKEAPKEEVKKSGELDDKAVKACLKEGGKKAQDCVGMSTFGTHFFCVTVESADGNMKLLEKVMEGMNAEVDEEAEDRKGGAADLGKILFNANDQKLVIMCHTPKEVVEKATAADWMAPVLTATGAKITSQTENMIQAELDNDPDHGIYSLKLRDQGISASFEFLRSRGLMIDDDSEDENYAAAAGINLNAAPGADY